VVDRGGRRWSARWAVLTELGREGDRNPTDPHAPSGRVLEMAKRSVREPSFVPVDDAKNGSRRRGFNEDLIPAGRRRIGRRHPAVADWLAGLDGPLVLGNYVYATDAANSDVASAVDCADSAPLQAEKRPRPGAPRSWPRPTDVVAVPTKTPRPVGPRARASGHGEPSSAGLSCSHVRRRLAPAGPYSPGSDTGICGQPGRPSRGRNLRGVAKRLRGGAPPGSPAKAARPVSDETSPRPPAPGRSPGTGCWAAAYGRAPGGWRREVVRDRYTPRPSWKLCSPRLYAGSLGRAGKSWQDEAYAAHTAGWGFFKDGILSPQSAPGWPRLLGYGAARKSVTRSGEGRLSGATHPAAGPRQQHPGQVVGEVGRDGGPRAPASRVARIDARQRDPLRRAIGSRSSARVEVQPVGPRPRRTRSSTKLVKMHGARRGYPGPDGAGPAPSGPPRGSCLKRLGPGPPACPRGVCNRPWCRRTRRQRGPSPSAGDEESWSEFPRGMLLAETVDQASGVRPDFSEVFEVPASLEHPARRAGSDQTEQPAWDAAPIGRGQARRSHRSGPARRKRVDSGLYEKPGLHLCL